MSGDTADQSDLTRLLPTELVNKFLDDLEPDEIVAVSQTCRRLRNIASAHDRFWHTCQIDVSINDGTDLEIQCKHFTRRARVLAALGLPISIVLRFRYDCYLGGSDDENDGGYDSRSFRDGVPADAGLQTWRKPIRFALSAEIAPSVVNFELFFVDMYAELVHDDLVPAKMPLLRRLNLVFMVDSESPLPAGLLAGSGPQLRDVLLRGINVDVRSQATPKILAFSNVTTASLLEINLAYIRNLALYLPSVVHLTIGPALWYDLDDAMDTTTAAEYLRDKHITPFKTTLSTLHLECTDFFDHHFPSLTRPTTEERCLILTQLIRGLAPHLRVMSMSRLSSAHVDKDVVLPVSDLAGVLARSVREFWKSPAVVNEAESARFISLSTRSCTPLFASEQLCQ